MDTDSQMTLDEVSDDKVAFIEKNVKEYFDFQIQCIQTLRAESITLMQWLFGMIAGGTGIAAPLFKDILTVPIGCGLLACALFASLCAAKLCCSFFPKSTYPPGNQANALWQLTPSEFRSMRIGEAFNQSSRADSNREIADDLGYAIEQIRFRMTCMPWIFIGVSLIALFICRTVSS